MKKGFFGRVKKGYERFQVAREEGAERRLQADERRAKRDERRAKIYAAREKYETAKARASEARSRKFKAALGGFTAMDEMLGKELQGHNRGGIMDVGFGSQPKQQYERVRVPIRKKKQKKYRIVRRKVRQKSYGFDPFKM